ncbi:MAG: hypothetical protein MJ171_03460 [Clostridia bacterium]|nr:hypothetical protein [Clostridia bacterium]
MGRKINGNLASGTTGQMCFENFELLSRLRLQVSVGDLTLVHPNNQFLSFASKRLDKDENYIFDVVGHGAATYMELFIDGRVKKIDHRFLARMLKHNSDFKKYKGVRLLSCNTGSSPDGFAQHLANKLGVPVYAPDTYYFANEKGVHFAAPMKSDNTPDYSRKRQLQKFVPGGKRK